MRQALGNGGRMMEGSHHGRLVGSGCDIEFETPPHVSSATFSTLDGRVTVQSNPVTCCAESC